MKIRKTLVEMAVIIFSASSLGLLYNYFAAPKPLPWVYVPRPVELAPDSALFAPSVTKADTNQSTIVISAEHAPTDSGVDSAKNKQSVAPNTKIAAQNSLPIVQSQKSGNQSSKPTVESPKPKALEVKYEQVLRLSKDPEVLFLDARKEHEFAEGHIPGAKSLSVLEFDKHVPDIIGLPRDKRIVVYCGGGLCELSHDLANNLIAFGFTRVFIYIGGYEDWKQQQKNN